MVEFALSPNKSLIYILSSSAILVRISQIGLNDQCQVHWFLLQLKVKNKNKSIKISLSNCNLKLIIHGRES